MDAGSALSPDADETQAGDELIIVTATRTARPLGEISQTVTVIDRDEVARETARSNNNLINLIARVAPGVSPPQGDGTSEDFTIRGRPVLFLIDGVPQNSNDGFATEFNAIDPAAIERIEVLRGASAIYGEGANGG
ncbi:MAG: Plug domain-containing protein, partial [Pseudomonadota bacterium]